MVIELRLPDDSMFRLMIAGASAQELESTLCKMTGLQSVSTYNHQTNEIVGWNDGKSYEVCRVLGKWKWYEIPDAK